MFRNSKQEPSLSKSNYGTGTEKSKLTRVGIFTWIFSYHIPFGMPLFGFWWINFTISHVLCLRTEGADLMQSSHFNFPGTLPDVMHSNSLSSTAFTSSSVHFFLEEFDTPKITIQTRFLAHHTQNINIKKNVKHTTRSNNSLYSLILHIGCTQTLIKLNKKDKNVMCSML